MTDQLVVADAFPAELVVARLEAIVAEAWQTILGIELTVVQPGQQLQPTDVSGVIAITGPVDATVVLQASEATVVSSAAEMLGMTVEELERSDALDAFGEMTNIVGGGVKAILPEPSALGLPAMVEGRNVRLTVPGASLVSGVVLLSSTGPVRASVWSPRA